MNARMNPTRSQCPCGNVAVKRDGIGLVCQQCLDIEKRIQPLLMQARTEMVKEHFTRPEPQTHPFQETHTR